MWILQCLQFQELKDQPKPTPPSTSEEEREKSAKAKKKKKKKKNKIENDEEPDQKQEASVENGITEDSEGAIILLYYFAHLSWTNCSKISGSAYMLLILSF